MKTNNDCQLKADSLRQILSSESVSLPVFVRFQTINQHVTVPVISVDTTEGGIKIQTTNAAPLHIVWEILVDIVAFVDGNGRPVFLTEISNGSNIAATFSVELEEQIEKEVRYRLKHQHEYTRKEEDYDSLRRPWEVGSQVEAEPFEYELAA